MVAEENQIARSAHISPEEYLVREWAAFEKSDYYQGEVIPMAFRIDTIDLVISLEKVYARTVGLPV